jgi:glycerophosphoryl diester phosphodiesterase
MELIAHRAGNLVELVAPAIDVADAIEIDVHLFRNRLEVRHAKVLLWPLSRLWEKWELLPRDAPRPGLAAIVDVVPDGVHMWFDLKGFTTRLPRAVHRVAAAREGVTYSSRHWWILGWVRRRTSGRTMKSVGNRFERWLVTRTRLHGPEHGVVVHERLLDDGSLARLRATEPIVVAWGVTDRDRARELIGRGIDGLILDDLDLIRALRAELDEKSG